MLCAIDTSQLPSLLWALDAKVTSGNTCCAWCLQRWAQHPIFACLIISCLLQSPENPACLPYIVHRLNSPRICMCLCVSLRYSASAVCSMFVFLSLKGNSPAGCLIRSHMRLELAFQQRRYTELWPDFRRRNPTLGYTLGYLRFMVLMPHVPGLKSLER